MSTIVIRYGGVDITSSVVFKETEFSMYVNGAPGPFSIKVKDVGFSHQFVSGKEVTLDIDGIRHFGGYCFRVIPSYIAAVDLPKYRRFWILTGFDYNILLQRRVIYDHTHPAKTELKSWPTGSHDDVVIKYVFDHYTDLGADGVTYAGVEHIGTPNPDKPGIIGSAGWTMAQALASINRGISGIWFINADKDLNFVDVDTPSNAIGLSDKPVAGSSVGYREFVRTINGTNLDNDQMVWGTGLGGGNKVVFSRVEDQPSIDLHGRWQAGEFNTSLIRQTSAELRASTFVYGTPQSKRGGKDDQISWLATLFQPIFRIGEKVAIESQVFDVSDVVPIRKVKITFATKARAKFALTLSHEIDEPWFIFEELFPSFGWKPPPPFPHEFNGQLDGPSDPPLCWTPSVPGDFYDTFDNRTDAGPASWGDASSGDGTWTIGNRLAGISTASVHDGVGELTNTWHSSSNEIRADTPLPVDGSKNFEMMIRARMTTLPPGVGSQFLEIRMLDLLNPPNSSITSDYARLLNPTPNEWYRIRFKWLPTVNTYKWKIWLESAGEPTDWTTTGFIGFSSPLLSIEPDTLRIALDTQTSQSGSAIAQIDWVAFRDVAFMLDCGQNASGVIHLTMKDMIGAWRYVERFNVVGPSAQQPSGFSSAFYEEAWNFVNSFSVDSPSSLFYSEYENDPNSSFFGKNGLEVATLFLDVPLPEGAYLAVFHTDFVSSYVTNLNRLGYMGVAPPVPFILRTGDWDTQPGRPLDFGVTIAESVVDVGADVAPGFPSIPPFNRPVTVGVSLASGQSHFRFWGWWLGDQIPFMPLAQSGAMGEMYFGEIEAIFGLQSDRGFSLPHWDGFTLDIFYSGVPVAGLGTLCEQVFAISNDNLIWSTSRRYLDNTTRVYLGGVLQRQDLDYAETSPDTGRITFLNAVPVGETVMVCYVSNGSF